MILDESILETLRCPAARVPLAVMTGAEMKLLNEAIAGGRAADARGESVTEPLAAALAAVDGSSAYRVDHGVPDLLPERRIVTSRRDSGASAGKPATGAGAAAALWEEWAGAWAQVVPPGRPAPDDVAMFERFVGESCAGRGARPLRALLLGVTPEIATMRWPAHTRLLALDFSEAMIRRVWPRESVRNATVARANWRTMPLADAAYDVVIGDGILLWQSFPEGVRALTEEIRRVLVGSGALVVRLFAKPDRPDTFAGVIDDLRHGRIRNSIMLHFRVAMSLHRDARTGVRCGDIYDAWHAAVPDEAELLIALGWPPATIGTFETYRGSDVTFAYPTVTELSSVLADSFRLIECRVPAYDDLGMFPTVVFRPRR